MIGKVILFWLKSFCTPIAVRKLKNHCQYLSVDYFRYLQSSPLHSNRNPPVTSKSWQSHLPKLCDSEEMWWMLSYITGMRCRCQDKKGNRCFRSNRFVIKFFYIDISLYWFYLQVIKVKRNEVQESMPNS